MRKIKEGSETFRFDPSGMRPSESPPGRRVALVERLSAFMTLPVCDPGWHSRQSAA
jgi:hypothetical protein